MVFYKLFSFRDSGKGEILLKAVESTAKKMKHKHTQKHFYGFFKGCTIFRERIISNSF